MSIQRCLTLLLCGMVYGMPVGHAAIPARPVDDGATLLRLTERNLPPGYSANVSVACQVVIKSSGRTGTAKCASFDPDTRSDAALLIAALHRGLAHARFTPAKFLGDDRAVVATLRLDATCEAGECDWRLRPNFGLHPDYAEAQHYTAPQEILPDGSTWADRLLRAPACKGKDMQRACRGDLAYGMTLVVEVDERGEVDSVSMAARAQEARPSDVVGQAARGLLGTKFVPATLDGKALGTRSVLLALHHKSVKRLLTKVCVEEPLDGGRMPDVDCYDRTGPVALEDQQQLVSWMRLPPSAMDEPTREASVAVTLGAPAPPSAPAGPSPCPNFPFGTEIEGLCYYPAMPDAGRRPLTKLIGTPDIRNARDGEASVLCQVEVNTKGRIETSKCFTEQGNTFPNSWSPSLAVQRALNAAQFLPASIEGAPMSVAMPLRVHVVCRKGRCERTVTPNFGMLRGQLGEPYVAPQEIIDSVTWYERLLRSEACQIHKGIDPGCDGLRGYQMRPIVRVAGDGAVADFLGGAAEPSSAIDEAAYRALAQGRFIPGHLDSGAALELPVMVPSLHARKNRLVSRAHCLPSATGKRCYSEQELAEHLATLNTTTGVGVLGLINPDVLFDPTGRQWSIGSSSPAYRVRSARDRPE
ncbi:MAG: hypothetical protein AAF184_05870 [Pseudomonadota bacterium]